jgi:hypothetical protein
MYEAILRRELKALGYRLMHRRNGQYWLMIDEPMTLNGIVGVIDRDIAAGFGSYIETVLSTAAASRNPDKKRAARKPL